MGPHGTPKYVSHKTVGALKITAIKPPVLPHDTITMLMVETAEVGFVIASAEFMARHKPKVGGYLVYYSDGYESYSPQEAFEEGYDRL